MGLTREPDETVTIKVVTTARTFKKFSSQEAHERVLMPSVEVWDGPMHP